MLVLLHVTVALGSILLGTLSAVKPSRARVRQSYISIGLTLVSGIFLVIKTHKPMLGACLTGLAYISVVAALLITAQKRLARLENSSEVKI